MRAAKRSSPTPITGARQRKRTFAWLVGGLLLVGTALFASDTDVRTHPQYLIALITAALSLIPAIARPAEEAANEPKAA